MWRSFLNSVKFCAGGHLLPARALHRANDAVMSLKCRIALSCAVTFGWLVRWDRLWQPLAYLLVCFAGDAYAEVVRLGGPRDIVVDVQDVRGGFSVTVEMRPVSCFDPATNARINRAKARLYGLVGLGQSLDIAPDRLAAGRDISGVEVDAAQQTDHRYRFRLFVPESGLVGQGQPRDDPRDTSAARAPANPARNQSQLFTCVDDHAATIEELKATYCEHLAEIEKRAVETLSRTSVGEHLEAARQALATFDTEASAAFKAAEQGFKADLRVLTVEKESLAKVLAAAQADIKARHNKASVSIQEAATRAAKETTPASPAPEANDLNSVR